ncbi:hypothetical protein [Paenibacillus aceris]|uniref:Uncharacterized protein n=1 Tax=Paenibacillus aceris TaxID=869555 RepID=A0ABS4I2G9_9BACL|nr:hypothetical protein [Paenibacillus aceris]MBP1965097.1 hypothetical protein [Paenibacillus aceris]NHW33080.1 hypothetical protein [Paenibacillus aceris]
MNKKLAMIGLGVAVGSMMLVTSVYAGVGDAPGYETFKSAVKQTAAVHNVTRQVNVTLQDNGAQLLNVKSTIKSNGENHAGSAEVTVKSGADEQTIHFYNQDGKQIIKTADSDVYKVLEDSGMGGKFKEREGAAHTPDPQVVSEVENVVDALVGNLKNYVTMDEAAGNVKEIHFKLSGSQISPVVNTIGSLAIKHGTLEKSHSPLPSKADTFGVDVTTLKNSLPQLTSDIKMDEVEVNASVDSDNHITNQTAQIHISGKDAQGTAHDVVLSVDMTLSSLNSTTPDTVDLTGKQLETVKFDPEKSHRNWGDKH